MSTILKLKKRPTRETLNLPLFVIKGFVDREDKDGLWNFFQSLANDDEVYVHDKHWLETLINWMPEGGVALTESAKWFKLADRVTDLDIEKEGTFNLSPYQTDLIWQRLIDPKFKMDRLPMPFVRFVQDFQQATGRHFPEEEPDVEDQPA
jgi:hypothetical protein